MSERSEDDDGGGGVKLQIGVVSTAHHLHCVVLLFVMWLSVGHMELWPTTCCRRIDDCCSFCHDDVN